VVEHPARIRAAMEIVAAFVVRPMAARYCLEVPPGMTGVN